MSNYKDIVADFNDINEENVVYSSAKIYSTKFL